MHAGPWENLDRYEKLKWISAARSAIKGMSKMTPGMIDYVIRQEARHKAALHSDIDGIGINIYKGLLDYALGESTVAASSPPGRDKSPPIPKGSKRG